MSLCSCTIARHLELRECSNGKAITKLKDDLVKLREAHSGEICYLEDKVKKTEDKYLTKEKEWGRRRKFFKTSESSNTLQKPLNNLGYIELRVLMNNKSILNKIFCMD